MEYHPLSAEVSAFPCSLAGAIDDIWVLTAVTIGVVETAVEATIELGSDWVSRKQEKRLAWEEGMAC